jgi:hypothetical protein
MTWRHSISTAVKDAAGQSGGLRSLTSMMSPPKCRACAEVAGIFANAMADNDDSHGSATTAPKSPARVQTQGRTRLPGADGTGRHGAQRTGEGALTFGKSLLHGLGNHLSDALAQDRIIVHWIEFIRRERLLRLQHRITGRTIAVRVHG